MLVQDFTSTQWNVQYIPQYSTRQFDLKDGERVAIRACMLNKAEGKVLNFWFPVFTEWWPENDPYHVGSRECPICT